MSFSFLSGRNAALRLTPNVVSACLLLVAFAAPAAAVEVPPDSGRKLVVAVAVDQMRADYLERFRDQFRGGLAKLRKEGAILTDAHQNHSETETGPGHSTLLSGVTPGHNGIVANEWFDRAVGKQVYCVGTTRYKMLGTDRLGASPENFKATTLGDWLKAKSPQSKVISISRKDRAAVLMGGQRADQAYWFDTTLGKFVTSEYYVPRLPNWFDVWAGLGLVDSYFGKPWMRLWESESAYRHSDPDNSPGEGALPTNVFPHRFESKSGRPDAGFYNYLINTPFIDELTLQLAEAAIDGEQLGQRGVTDLLAISFSATDYIGHNFGPDSQEIHDQILRLDLVLGRLFATLDRVLGPRNYVLVLSADHAVLPLPEHLSKTNSAAKRVGKELAQAVSDLGKHLEAQLGAGKWMLDSSGSGGLYFNTELAKERGRDIGEIEQMACAFLKGQAVVAGCYTRKDLESTTPPNDSYVQRIKNSYDPSRSGNVFFRVHEYALVSTRTTGTTHGSPYDYDSHVPMVFWGKPFKKGKYNARAATVDIAPTLAAWLGLQPPQPVDGRTLTKILGQ